MYPSSHIIQRYCIWLQKICVKLDIFVVTLFILFYLLRTMQIGGYVFFVNMIIKCWLTILTILFLKCIRVLGFRYYWHNPCWLFYFITNGVTRDNWFHKRILINGTVNDEMTKRQREYRITSQWLSTICIEY